ncbi:universal stress protein [Rhodothermus sp. AH-315-K08]|nr:universal stress protein [Rhodothermus sp. AH-315-K08]
MIKKILVALDPDSDSLTATQHAVDIARRYQASVTGLAVVDMGSIAASSRGGGIGTMYFADKLRARLTAEARETAQTLIAAFDAIVKAAGIEFTELVQEGVPFRRIVEDMKYHDLLVVGKEPHFFYSHPKEATQTLARVVKKTIGPTLIVAKKHVPIKKVLIAYDGSLAAAQSLRSFVTSKPFGKDLEVRLMQVYADNQQEAELELSLAADFMRAHDVNPAVLALSGENPEAVISQQIEQFGADVVVAGAHSKSRIRAVAFGSTTAHLVEHCPVTLYLDH